MVKLPSFDGATEWLNSGPLTPQALQGRVVLVSFGTYTCINWIRTLPYVRAWADKYSGHGLAVVGVQTPEFDFEGDLDNVRRAVEEMDVRYPLAVDNDYTIWRAFDNHYWPALYFADIQGQIRHHYFGEGEYEESERVIQELLAEAGVEGVDTALVRPQPRGVELGADWDELKSPENYVGYQRTEGFASPGGPVLDEPHAYEAPSSMRRNEWALSGVWLMSTASAALTEPGGAISCRFHARDLNLVMGPADVSGTSPVPGPHRRSTARGLAWHRRGRRRQWDCHMATPVPIGPPTGADRRPELRYRVPRRRRRGICVHLRMTWST